MFKNLKIGVRLGFGFGFVLVLLLIIASLAFVRVSGLSNDIQDMVNNKYPNTIAAQNIIDQLNMVARVTRNAIMTTRPEEAQAEMGRIPAGSKIITESIEKLEKTIATEEWKKLLKIVGDTRKEYVSDLNKLRELIGAGKREESTVLIFGSMRKSQADYIDSISKL